MDRFELKNEDICRMAKYKIGDRIKVKLRSDRDAFECVVMDVKSDGSAIIQPTESIATDDELRKAISKSNNDVNNWVKM